MATAEVLPVAPLPDGRDRGSFATAYVWPYECVLTDSTLLATEADAEIVSADLGRARQDRLARYIVAAI